MKKWYGVIEYTNLATGEKIEESVNDTFLADVAERAVLRVTESLAQDEESTDKEAWEKMEELENYGDIAFLGWFIELCGELVYID